MPRFWGLVIRFLDYHSPAQTVTVPKKRAGALEPTMPYCLYLSKVERSENCPFPRLLAQILQECERPSLSRYRTQARILGGRRLCATHLIDGLFEVSRAISWKFLLSEEPIVVLCLPLSSHGYTNGGFKDYSHAAMHDVIDALRSLGFIESKAGQQIDGQNFQTELWPTKCLLETHFDVPFSWRPRKASRRNLVVLKNYDAKEKRGYPVPFSETKQTRLWNRNIRKINQALCDSAIAMNADEYTISCLRREMARSDYRRPHDLENAARALNFSKVELRRVFARKSFKRGGRFYGAWWLSIPSSYRRHITINGMPTVELDFAGLHPRLMYFEANQLPPEGDFYDLGYEGPDKKRARDIFKKAFNAVINDDTGHFQLEAEDCAFLKMSTAEVKQRIFDKHPLAKELAGKGRGLYYQFIDSQIAERVMLKLLDQGIVCLPIHDSFIVAQDYEEQLRIAMHEAFHEVVHEAFPWVVGGDAVLKPAENAVSDFEPVFMPSRNADELDGPLNLCYLRNLHLRSPVHQYVDSYFAQRVAKPTKAPKQTPPHV